MAAFWSLSSFQDWPQHRRLCINWLVNKAQENPLVFALAISAMMSTKPLTINRPGHLQNHQVVLNDPNQLQVVQVVTTTESNRKSAATTLL